MNEFDIPSDGSVRGFLVQGCVVGGYTDTSLAAPTGYCVTPHIASIISTRKNPVDTASTFTLGSYPIGVVSKTYLTDGTTAQVDVKYHGVVLMKVNPFQSSDIQPGQLLTLANTGDVVVTGTRSSAIAVALGYCDVSAYPFVLALLMPFTRSSSA
jgi:hypothetical protein